MGGGGIGGTHTYIVVLGTHRCLVHETQRVSMWPMHGQK